MVLKNYLFVCEHNFTRSRFGAEFLRGYLLGKGKEAKVISRGLGFILHFLGRRLKKKDLGGIRMVFVMEDYMEEMIIRKWNYKSSNIVGLNINDKYGSFKRKSIIELDKKFRKIKCEKYL